MRITKSSLRQRPSSTCSNACLSKEDPWEPIRPIFSQEEHDEDFQRSVEFVSKYAKGLSEFMNKRTSDRSNEDEWILLLEVINRFFLFVTVFMLCIAAFITLYMFVTQLD